MELLGPADLYETSQPVGQCKRKLNKPFFFFFKSERQVKNETHKKNQKKANRQIHGCPINLQ